MRRIVLRPNNFKQALTQNPSCKSNFQTISAPYHPANPPLLPLVSGGGAFPVPLQKYIQKSGKSMQFIQETGSKWHWNGFVWGLFWGSIFLTISLKGGNLGVVREWDMNWTIPSGKQAQNGLISQIIELFSTCFWVFLLQPSSGTSCFLINSFAKASQNKPLKKWKSVKIDCF